MGYIKQKLKDIFGKIVGYIWNKLWDIFATLWDIFGLKFKLNYGIYLVKIMGFFSKNMGYIWQ